MHLKIECDDEGEQLLCELFAEMLENKWAAEMAPPEPLYRGTKIFVRAADLAKDGIVIY